MDVLHPLFSDLIQRSPPGKIENLNKDTIAALSGKRKTLSRPTRRVKYKATAKLPCKKCDLTFLNNSQLNMHKKSQHTAIQTASTYSFPLVDDVSVLDLTCDTKEQLAIAHEVSHHVTEHQESPKIIEVLDDDIFCKKCNFEGINHNNLKEHIRNEHDNVLTELDIIQMGGKIMTEYFCDPCGFVAECEKDLDNHIHTKHAKTSKDHNEDDKVNEVSKNHDNDNIAEYTVEHCWK